MPAINWYMQLYTIYEPSLKLFGIILQLYMALLTLFCYKAFYLDIRPNNVLREINFNCVFIPRIYLRNIPSSEFLSRSLANLEKMYSCNRQSHNSL